MLLSTIKRNAITFQISSVWSLPQSNHFTLWRVCHTAKFWLVRHIALVQKGDSGLYPLRTIPVHSLQRSKVDYVYRLHTKYEVHNLPVSWQQSPAEFKLLYCPAINPLYIHHGDCWILTCYRQIWLAHSNSHGTMEVSKAPVVPACPEGLLVGNRNYY